MTNKYYKLIFFALLFISISINFASEIDENKKMLEQIQNELARRKKLLNEGTILEKQYLEDIKFLEKRIKYYKSKIKALENKQIKLKVNIKKSDKEINKSNKKIENNYKIFNQMIKKFIFLNKSKELNKTSIMDDSNLFILRKMINCCADTLEKLCFQCDRLEDQMKKKKKELQSSEIKESQKLSSIEYFSFDIKDKRNKYQEVQNKIINHKKEIKTLEEEAHQLQKLIVNLKKNQENKDFSYKFRENLLYPVEGEIIRKFGKHIDKKYNTEIINQGIDIKTKEGTPVNSIANGVVIFADWFKGKGKLVIIDHQNGFYSLYGHNSDILVHKGDRVKVNQIIAYSGDTGSRYGCCLHFEIRKNGVPVNPTKYLNQNEPN